MSLKWCLAGIGSVLLLTSACGKPSTSVLHNNFNPMIQSNQTVIPEYYQGNGVAVHQSLLGSVGFGELLTKLQVMGVPYVGVISEEGSSMVKDQTLERIPVKTDIALSPWVRDWVPITTISNRSESLRLVQFTMGAYGKAEDAATDAIGYQLNLSVIRVPVDVHATQMTSNGFGDCAVESNRNGEDASAFQKLLVTNLGCRRVLAFPSIMIDATVLPFDDWLRFASDDVAIVGTLVAKNTWLGGDNNIDLAEVDDAQMKLDAIARRFDEYGYAVIRAPIILFRNDPSGRLYEFSMGAGLNIREQYLIPRRQFLASRDTETYDVLEANFVENVKNMGGTTHMITIDEMISETGSLHRAIAPLGSRR